jgi:guanylate kinase
MGGKLVIISAPSGAGKTTIVRHLLDSGLNLSFSISATTRALRGDEQDGKDYYFLTAEEFKKKISDNNFVEWEEVYKGLMYGTLRSEMERIWSMGRHVLFDVDVKGGINLKKKFGSDSLAIFLKPPSVEELENRLKLRATESEEKIRMRVEKAKEEIKLADQFDHIVINDDLELAKEKVLQLVSDFITI